jgi:hypothetical protein
MCPVPCRRRLSRECDATGLAGMFELAVTVARSHMKPAIALEHFQHISDLH